MVASPAHNLQAFVIGTRRPQTHSKTSLMEASAYSCHLVPENNGMHHARLFNKTGSGG